VSENLVDLGGVRRIGTGENLYIVIQVTTTLASSGSNDAMDVNLYADGDSAFGSPTFNQRLCTLAAVAAAGTVAIARISPKLPLERYTGLYYISQTSDAFSAAGITAFITHDVDAWVAYAKGYTIS
jgi:hypothetical protein